MARERRIALAALRLSAAPFLLASLGGSCVILFGMPDSSMAQPRSLLGGHLIGVATGLVFGHAFGGSLVVMTCAVATALALMMVTDTLHSPAGANPLIVIANQCGWFFIVNPVAVGLAILLIGAALYHRAWLGLPYPRGANAQAWKDASASTMRRWSRSRGARPNGRIRHASAFAWSPIGWPRLRRAKHANGHDDWSPS